ncbi:MAG TPA: succinate dehydrogenase assembly factor 2 [Caulobacteraceae bacterium]
MDDTRLKKLKFRAWHRGFREADLILGPFAESHAQLMTPDELDAFEALLEENDHDIYGWIVGREPPPPEHRRIIVQLQAFKPAGLTHGA